MATIKLDISEYKLMEENKELLEQALKREEELHDKLEQSQQEKIDAMEANQKKVTIVEEITKTETCLVRRGAEETIERLLHRIRHYGRSGYGTWTAENELDYIVSAFFEKTEAVGRPVKKEVTYQGLDEVTERIRKELMEQLRFDHEKHKLDLKQLAEKLKLVEEIKQSLSRSLELRGDECKKWEVDYGQIVDENLQYEEYVEYLEAEIEKLKEEAAKPKKKKFFWMP